MRVQPGAGLWGFLLWLGLFFGANPSLGADRDDAEEFLSLIHQCQQLTDPFICQQGLRDVIIGFFGSSLSSPHGRHSVLNWVTEVFLDPAMSQNYEHESLDEWAAEVIDTLIILGLDLHQDLIGLSVARSFARHWFAQTLSLLVSRGVGSVISDFRTNLYHELMLGEPSTYISPSYEDHITTSLHLMTAWRVPGLFQLSDEGFNLFQLMFRNPHYVGQVWIYPHLQNLGLPFHRSQNGQNLLHLLRANIGGNKLLSLIAWVFMQNPQAHRERDHLGRIPLELSEGPVSVALYLLPYQGDDLITESAEGLFKQLFIEPGDLNPPLVIKDLRTAFTPLLPAPASQEEQYGDFLLGLYNGLQTRVARMGDESTDAEARAFSRALIKEFGRVLANDVRGLVGWPKDLELETSPRVVLFLLHFHLLGHLSHIRPQSPYIHMLSTQFASNEHSSWVLVRLLDIKTPGDISQLFDATVPNSEAALMEVMTAELFGTIKQMRGSTALELTEQILNPVLHTKMRELGELNQWVRSKGLAEEGSNKLFGKSYAYLIRELTPQAEGFYTLLLADWRLIRGLTRALRELPIGEETQELRGHLAEAEYAYARVKEVLSFLSQKAYAALARQESPLTEDEKGLLKACSELSPELSIKLDDFLLN